MSNGGRARSTRALYAVLLSCLGGALVVPASACQGTQDIHQSSEAKSKACIDCHASAYALVRAPVHAGVFPTTCGECHATAAWIPASGGHPEGKFPITTGSHSNKAIGCSDCHVASLGANTGGQNTDCVHCHLGAHVAPAVDALHVGMANYPGLPDSPHSCLNAGCHPSG